MTQHSRPARSARSRLLRFAAYLGVVAVLALPLAVTWGVGQASATDYLGPHRATFAVNFDHAVTLDLGPLGTATLPQHYGPLGVEVQVGPLGSATGTSVSLFSEQTLDAYANLYADPDGTVRGIGAELVGSALRHAVAAELVLLGFGVLWHRRASFLTFATLGRTGGTRRGLLGYAMVVVLCVGSALAPPPPDRSPHYRVTVGAGTPLAGMTVDNGLLADLLNRGISGARLLAERQLAAVDTYVAQAGADLGRQQAELPQPTAGETMVFGLSDLHCSQAMTRLYTDLVRRTSPAAVFSAGDDTMNGTAAESGCITREVAMSHDVPGADGVPGPVPFLDTSGNHDSAVTDTQLARAGAVVIDGQPVQAAGLSWLGDDDPEQQVPFSISRIRERPESEAQLGGRILDLALGRPVDVIMLHQPTATLPVVEAPDPPARLVVWGHLHAQDGPRVIPHADGSWTVAVQLGTAGGVAQPIATSFSTPFSPPRKTADCYFFFRDDVTGLFTGVQPIHFLVDGTVVIDPRIATGDLRDLSRETRERLSGAARPSSALPSRVGSPAPTGTPSAPVRQPAGG